MFERSTTNTGQIPSLTVPHMTLKDIKMTYLNVTFRRIPMSFLRLWVFKYLLKLVMVLTCNLIATKYVLFKNYFYYSCVKTQESCSEMDWLFICKTGLMMGKNRGFYFNIWFDNGRPNYVVPVVVTVVMQICKIFSSLLCRIQSSTQPHHVQSQSLCSHSSGNIEPIVYICDDSVKPVSSIKR